MPETPVVKPIRTSIKIAAKVVQIARLIYLMPTPQDFANRIAADIIYMSSLIQKFVSDINKVMDGYSNIPWDYLNNQLYSVVDSANNVLNRAQAYSDYMVENTLGLGKDVLALGNEVYEMSIDVATHGAQTASSFGAAIASTSEDILGNHDVAQKIRDNVPGWTPADGDNPIKEAMGAVAEAEAKAKGIIDDVANDAKDAVNSAGQFVQSIINKLKGMVDKMSADVDAAFGNIINKDQILDTTGKLSGLSGYDKALASQVVGATSTAINNIVQNFSLGKFVTAFLGVATNAVLITTGLNELPPVNFDKMLDEFRGQLEKNPLKNVMSDISFDDLIEYDPTTYNNLVESFELELKKQREANLNKKKNIFNVKSAEAKEYIKASISWYNNMSKTERNNIKSAMNEIKKKRKKAKNAKVAVKLKDVVLQELKKLQDECKKFAKRLEEEWNAMLKQYKDAVKEIETFFHLDGPGDQYVEDLCLDINQQCANIVQLCTIDMPVELAGSATKAALPYCFGMAIPNYAHNVVSFIVDIKIILKFIMDLISYVMKILDDIKKIAQLFLIAFKKLRDMINQLLDMLGLGWLMDLVEDIIDTLNDKVDETCEKLEGTLTPVYLKDLNMYPGMLDEVQKFVSEFSGLVASQQKYNNTTNTLVRNELNTNFQSMYEKIGLTPDTGYINGLLVMMGVEPIDLTKNEGNTFTGWSYLNEVSYQPFYNPVSFGSGDYRFNFSFDENVRTVEYHRLTSGYNNEHILEGLKDRIKQIKAHDAVYIAAYKTPHFPRNSVNMSSQTKSLRTYNDIDFTIQTSYDPSVIDSWVYYHPNLNHYGYDIVANAIGKTGKIYYSEIKLSKETKEKYETFMQNAANKPTPSNDWLSEVIAKPKPIGPWSGLNINGDSIITANEAFYWFGLDNETDDMYEMFNPPNTPTFDELYGDGGSDSNDDKEDDSTGYIINLSVKTDTGTAVNGLAQVNVDGKNNYVNFNRKGNEMHEKKVWNYLSTSVSKFGGKCMGNRIGYKLSETIIETDWSIENALFNYKTATFSYEVDGGTQTNLSKSENVTLKNGTYTYYDSVLEKDVNITINSQVYTINPSNVTIVNNSSIKIPTIHNGKSVTVTIPTSGNNITISDNKIRFIEGSKVIIIDTVRLVVIENKKLNIYGMVSSNVIEFNDENLSNQYCIPKGDPVTINANIHFKDTGSGSVDEIYENKSCTINLNVYSATGKMTNGFSQITANGIDYSKSYEVIGSKLSEKKTWNYLPGDVEEFDARCVGDRQNPNEKENVISTYWNIKNAKCKYNEVKNNKIVRTVEITNGERYNYPYSDSEPNKVILNGNSLIEYNVENANMLNLANCVFNNGSTDATVNVTIRFTLSDDIPSGEGSEGGSGGFESDSTGGGTPENIDLVVGTHDVEGKSYEPGTDDSDDSDDDHNNKDDKFPLTVEKSKDDDDEFNITEIGGYKTVDEPENSDEEPNYRVTGKKTSDDTIEIDLSKPGNGILDIDDKKITILGKPDNNGNYDKNDKKIYIRVIDDDDNLPNKKLVIDDFGIYTKDIDDNNEDNIKPSKIWDNMSAPLDIIPSRPNVGDDNNATIVSGGVYGSVARIWIDGKDGNKESRLVFVKNRILKNGDWIIVKCPDGKQRYFQAHINN